MSNLLSTIYDFIGVLFLGGTILLFGSEIRLAMMKEASKGSTKLSTFSERMTGEKFDLSDKRVYGK
jgi:hypothetical protein